MNGPSSDNMEGPAKGDTDGHGARHEAPTPTSETSNELILTTKDIGNPSIDMVHGNGLKSSRSRNRKSTTFGGKVCSWRYAIVLLLHTSFMVAVFVRTCMPMALVCMTQKPSTTMEAENASLTLPNLEDNSGGTSSNETESEYEFAWDTDIQGLVLSSVFFLPVLAPLITSAVQPLLGSKMTLSVINMVCVVVCLLTPLATRADPWLLVACRILVGATFGSNVPIAGDMVAWWAPSAEKMTMITITFAGLQTGGIVTSLISGYMCLIPIDYGWPFIFYFVGLINLIWVFAWYFLSSDKPEDHKFISEKELYYIQTHRQMKNTANQKAAQKIPYKTILTSGPVLVFMCSTSLMFWTVTLYLTYLPIYLARVLKFATTEAGVLVSMYAVVRCIGMAFWTCLANWMQGAKKISNTRVKKVLTFIGMSVAGLSQLGIIFLDVDHKWTIVGLATLTMFCQSAGLALLPAIPQDLAPRYAGFITGIFFSLGNLLSISAPLLVTFLTPNNTIQEWRHVWIVMTSVFVSIMIVYVLFGSSSLQPWADDRVGMDVETTIPSPPDARDENNSAGHSGGGNTELRLFTSNVEMEDVANYSSGERNESFPGYIISDSDHPEPDYEKEEEYDGSPQGLAGTPRRDLDSSTELDNNITKGASTSGGGGGGVANAAFESIEGVRNRHPRPVSYSVPRWTDVPTDNEEEEDDRITEVVWADNGIIVVRF